MTYKKIYIDQICWNAMSGERQEGRYIGSGKLEGVEYTCDEGVSIYIFMMNSTVG